MYATCWDHYYTLDIVAPPTCCCRSCSSSTSLISSSSTADACITCTATLEMNTIEEAAHTRGTYGRCAASGQSISIHGWLVMHARYTADNTRKECMTWRYPVQNWWLMPRPKPMPFTNNVQAPLLQRIGRCEISFPVTWNEYPCTTIYIYVHIYVYVYFELYTYIYIYHSPWPDFQVVFDTPQWRACRYTKQHVFRTALDERRF